MLILGYEEDDLVGGSPKKGNLPVYVWRQDPERLKFPLDLDVQLPDGVVLFVVIDVDQNGRMSEKDVRTDRWKVSAQSKDIIELASDVVLQESYASGEVAGEVIAQSSAGRPVSRKIGVSASSDYGRRWEGAVLVLGYLPSEEDASKPRPDVLPQYIWRRRSVSADFPFDLEVPLPPDLLFVVILDITGDLQPNAGDGMSSYFGRPGARDVAAARVAQPYRAAAVGITNTGSESTRTVSDGGGVAVPRELLIRITPPVPPDWKSPVMVVGFPEGIIHEGFPSKGGMHRFYWESPGSIEDWPLSLNLDLPKDLLFLVVLDRDGDRRPSLRDWSSAAFGAGAANKSLEVAVGRLFEPSGSDEGDGQSDEDDGDEEGCPSKNLRYVGTCLARQDEDEDEPADEDDRRDIGTRRPVS